MRLDPAIIRKHNAEKTMGQVDPNTARRPSQWHEDQNEREVPPTPDYQTSPLAEEPMYGFVPPPNPVPVYITEPVPRDGSIRNWGPMSATITNKPERLAGSDRNRVRMIVTNNSTDKVVYLARRFGDLSINAYPLNFGRDVELTHNDEVWAFCLSSDTAPVGWFTEYNLEDL